MPNLDANNMIPNVNGYKDFPGHNFWPGNGVMTDPKIPGHHFMPEKDFGKNFFPSPDLPGHNYFHEDRSCDLPLAVGTCGGHWRRYYYNNSTKRCEEFVFKGCEGNSNNFENPEVCKQTCAAKEVISLKREEKDANYTCGQEVFSGLCFSSFKRFYFNRKTKSCHEFIYSGCEGNANNFYFPSDCLKLCNGNGIKYLIPPTTTGSKDDGHNHGNDGHGGAHDRHGDHLDPKEAGTVCNLSLDKGTPSCPEFGSKPRFYHNSTTNMCEEFLYTGCEGNLNNFIHGDNCKKLCKAKEIRFLGGQRPTDRPIPIHPDCLQAVIRGTCTGSYVAYFFNPSTRACQAYVYSGCGSSPNHFASSNECVTRCPAMFVNPYPIYV